MKGLAGRRAFLTVLVVFFGLSLATGQTWQYGRIKDVRKSVATNAKVWVANTPIEEEITTYTVSVQMVDKLFVGTYEWKPEEAAPPEEWTPNYPVKVLLERDTMLVRGPTGEVRLRIAQRKSTRMMLPLSLDEKKQLADIEKPAKSLVGFADESPSAGPSNASSTAAPTPAAPQPPANVGTVTVRSTPYLSEVFVDGDSMGYTPAKINLAPGKHTFRVEKPGYRQWTKELMITVGSELTLDATLERGK